MHVLDILSDLFTAPGAALQMAAVFAIFALGGFTKGAIAHGLPLVAVPLLSNFFPVPVAVAIALPSVLVTNFYQSAFVGSPVASLKRIWPMLAMLVIVMALTTKLLVTLDAEALLGIVGLVSVVMAGAQLAGFTVTIKPEREKITGAIVGLVAGVMGGLTSLFSMPLILFLATLRMPKDDFVNALSLHLFSGAAVLTVALTRFEVFTLRELMIALVSFVPLGLGYAGGAALRRKLDQQAYMRLIYSVLIAIGIWMMIKGWLI